MSATFELKAYVSHLLSAKGRHGIHSPFVYELVTQILVPEKTFYCFSAIEEERHRLLNDKGKIIINDLGAGSRNMRAERRVCEIARKSLQPKPSAQAMFRLVNHFGPKHVLELGTSLGITTSYLAMANNEASVRTIEGSAPIASCARQVFANLGITNIDLIEGNFDDVLPGLLSRIGKVDTAFIDGNHRYLPTIDYFRKIISYCSEDSWIVLDDIHWSAEMQRAWDELRDDSRVTMSLDFFHFGILFLKKNREKEHFTLRLP